MYVKQKFPSTVFSLAQCFAKGMLNFSLNDTSDFTTTQPRRFKSSVTTYDFCKSFVTFVVLKLVSGYTFFFTI